MSYLAQLNAFLADTREMSVKQLNKMIKELDPSAEQVKNQQVAHSVLGYLMSAKIKGETPSFVHAFARVEKLKSDQPWLYVEPAPKVVVPGVIEAAPAAKAEKPKAVRGEKKSDVAAKIFAGLTDKSKENVIAVFMEKLGTTRAGAQTYFYAVGGEKSGRKGRTASIKGAAKQAKGAGVPTKRAQAEQLFAAAPVKTRDAIVELFMEKLSMTRAGATTYAYAVGVAPVRKGVKK